MDNLAKANVQLKLTINEDFHRGTVFFSRFLITKSQYLKRNRTLA